mgnify:CR=1 FL=1
MDAVVKFMKNIDWRLVFVGTVMALIAIGIIYVLIEVSRAIQARKASAEVTLPNLNEVDKEESEAKFETPPVFEIEFVDEDNIPQEEFSEPMGILDEDVFIEAITHETGKLYVKEDVDVDLPDVTEVEDEEIIEELDESVILDEAHSELDELEKVMFNTDEVEELHYEIVDDVKPSKELEDDDMFEDLLDDILEEDEDA